MRIISKKTLRMFWEKNANSEQPLRAWCGKVKNAQWQKTSDVKADYQNASFVANNRVIFNIKGNNYRLITAINYDYMVVYIRFVGHHKDYDKIDATTL